MKHLTLELFALTMLVILMQYRVIRISFNFNPIHRNAKKITVWLAEILIKTILSSWLK